MDDMMRVAGRNAGGYAKAIQTDDRGNLKTLSHIEHELATKTDRKGFPQSAFEKRNTELDILEFTHAASESGQPLGVFDQMITLIHNYDKPVHVTIYPCYYDGKFKWLYTLTELIMPTSTVGNGDTRISLVPEATENITSGSNQVYQFSELRQPIPLFQIRLTYPEGAPTTGELKIMTIKRF